MLNLDLPQPSCGCRVEWLVCTKWDGSIMVLVSRCDRSGCRESSTLDDGTLDEHRIQILAWVDFVLEDAYRAAVAAQVAAQSTDTDPANPCGDKS